MAPTPTVIDVHVLLVRAGAVLLTRGAATWALPCGRPEPGEPLPDAAARVARARLGVTAAAATHVHTSHVVGCGSQCRLGAFFEVDAWTGTPAADADLRWAPLDALPADVQPYSRSGLVAYRQGVTFGAFDWDALTAPAFA
ncbi:NUDIX domain-containing protein [Actinokineospora bangkokensis]|uniref:Nudix hydrolase domain-containing protein n=1 Tax=Actinokineospora bangkokensis TaxID=1193682 RepID=A0A1Q9LG83_9PSEU|nr:NUDIX domain-containing protein [Actinokineospora bangkokensis]OLR90959.1 hypothetical protein BJP25_30895 [Actinokineospora bangkokensis]